MYSCFLVTGIFAILIKRTSVFRYRLENNVKWHRGVVMKRRIAPFRLQQHAVPLFSVAESTTRRPPLRHGTSWVAWVGRRLRWDWSGS